MERDGSIERAGVENRSESGENGRSSDLGRESKMLDNQNRNGNFDKQNGIEAIPESMCH